MHIEESVVQCQALFFALYDLRIFKTAVDVGYVGPQKVTLHVSPYEDLMLSTPKTVK